jgi:hypothetical protein
MKLALTKEVTRRRPTFISWILIIALIAAFSAFFILNVYQFLAPDREPQKGLMVVEGWIHDFALDEAVAMYRTGNYSKIICTGVPIETGSYISQFKSYPEMTATRLKKLGVPQDKIVLAIADDVKKDRTYASAVALREAFMAYNLTETDLHLVTVGPHGRRSSLLYQLALGDDYTIGVTCLEPSEYDEKDWYTNSEGVRSVMSEFIAYLYAKLLFKP